MPILTEGDVLLADIIANPGDDGLRLIYADWLEESGGDPFHARLIRHQMSKSSATAYVDNVPHVCEQRGGRFEARWSTCGSRHPRGFIAWVRKTLPAPDDRSRFNGVWHKGFLADLSCSLSWWQRHGPALVRAHPLTRVELCDAAPSNFTGLTATWLDTREHSTDRRDNWLPAWLFRSVEIAHMHDSVAHMHDSFGAWDLTYKTREGRSAVAVANDALSFGCLHWAKAMPPNFPGSSPTPAT